MSAILEFLVNPWVQMIMWLIAGVVIYQFRSYMQGVTTWNWIAAGVIVYGIRIGYKLFPFSKAGLLMEAGRYFLGIIGISLIFIGIIKYYYNNFKPIAEGI